MKHRQTLSRSILICFLILSITSAAVVLAFYMIHSTRALKTRIQSERQLLLNHAMDSLDTQLTMVNEFAYWVVQNDTITELLKRNAGEAAQYDDVNYAAAQELQRQLGYRPITRDIISMAVIGDNGLTLCAGQEGYLLDTGALSAPEAVSSASETHWGALTANPNRISRTPSVLPYRHIIKNASGQRIGVLYLFFYPDLIADALQNIIALDDGSVTVEDQNGDLLYTTGSGSSASFQLSEISPATKWKLNYTVTDAAFKLQVRQIWYSIAALAILMIPALVFLSVYLSRNLSAPIEQLAGHIRRIGRQDFHAPRETYSGREMQELDAELTKMGEAIQTLIREQEEKKQLELTLLQSQLNPHFLYNTLNSIRSMAAMQNKNSVAEMIDALNVLLRANLSGSGERITLKEEMEITRSYLFLQNTRLKGRLNYTLNCPDALADCQVLKFLLQPLAENAVIHGIGNAPLGGTIAITAETDAEHHLLIRISDNGAGMSEETLAALRQQLFQNQPVSSRKNGRRIGIYNTNERIRLYCGNAYGIRISSEIGRGSLFTLVLPLQKHQKIPNGREADRS